MSDIPPGPEDDLAIVLSTLLALQEGQSAMRGEITAELGKLRGDLMDRMDRFGDELSAIHEDIIVNFGATDHVRRGNLNTREELRLLGDQVTAMTRQILRLQTEVRDLKRGPPEA